MGRLKWQEGSKELFDKMMGVVPDEMKSMAEPMLTGMITQKAADGPVTRQVLSDVVDGLPEPQMSMLKGVLAEAETSKEDTQGGLKWQEGSKELFDKMMGVVPDEMKSMAEPMLTGMITQKAADGTVTRQVLSDVVDGLPEPQKSLLKGVLSSGEAVVQGKEELRWEDRKVEQLFERLVQAAPAGMQDTFRGMFLNMLQGMAGGRPVSETIIRKLVEGSSEPQRSVLMKVIDAPEPADPEQIGAIVERCGIGPENIDSVLRESVKVMGHLSHGAVMEVAQQTGVAAAHIYHLATTRKIYNVTPPAEHKVTVCAGMGCYVRDKAGNIDNLAREVSQKQDAVLEKIRCLGCCDCGPMAEVDGKKMTVEEALAGLDAQKAKKARLKVEAETCTGCGGCIDLCPATAINLIDDIAEIVEELCTGCKTCLMVCPTNSIAEL